jgi:hypothetical protein
VPRADRFDDTASNVVFAATRIRLVDCVELGAAACNLGTVKIYPLTLEVYIHPFRGDFPQRGGCMQNFRQNRTIQIRALGP